jgi:cytochrome c peroxidase
LVAFCRTNSKQQNEKSGDSIPPLSPALAEGGFPDFKGTPFEGYKQPLGMHKEAKQPYASIDIMTVAGASSAQTNADSDQVAQSNTKRCTPLNPGGFLPLGCAPIPQAMRSDIKNLVATIALGKALFWDIQAGSDGITACASCHFSSGADTRRFNTINPGPDEIFASDGVNGIGQLYQPVFIKNDDRVGSAGVPNLQFVGINPDIKIASDICTPVVDPIFKNLRQVTGRNSPSVIGTVYHRQLFWDGRANQAFNGNDPFGKTGNASRPVSLCENCALASQAVAPVISPVEMSCNGRIFNGHESLGSKLLVRYPLAFQKISPTDSVLGNYANRAGLGMICDQASKRLCTYQELIDLAFDSTVAGPRAVMNFSRLWGQALQAYQATLIPSRTPFDAYLEGNTSALTTRQVQGFNIFRGKGFCFACHGGPELSDATVSFFKINGPVSSRGTDTGFHNIGVRPIAEDLGRGGPGPKGIPFAESNSEKNNGAFKTPMLRNVKYTAPYFHNGEAPKLEDVVEFYDRGGDFPQKDQPVIRPLGLAPDEKVALVDFLSYALSDQRIQDHKAPFDHPSLPFPTGAILVENGAAGGPEVFVDAAGNRLSNSDKK